MTEIIDVPDMVKMKELLKRKKKLMAAIRRNSKAAIKARIEKRKINEELRRLRSKENLFSGLSKDEAQAKMRRMIDDVNPKDVYPRNLEKRFDRLDAAESKDSKIVEMGSISDRVPARRAKVTQPEAEEIIEEGDQFSDSEVIDLSDQ